MRTKPARLIEVPPRRINDIGHGERALTAYTALQPGEHYGASGQFWLTLQTDYGFNPAEGRVVEQIAAITFPKAA
ncbi:helix-turn-helix transcriptional regulator [Corynebacterium sp. A21]|uniref:helix-turn-helix transcriptional regulator n=1 Tax=Corynebacterium sp. A21 TaxID=3457318 RepID=UPI003FD0F4A2